MLTINGKRLGLMVPTLRFFLVWLLIVTSYGSAAAFASPADFATGGEPVSVEQPLVESDSDTHAQENHVADEVIVVYDNAGSSGVSARSAADISPLDAFGISVIKEVSAADETLGTVVVAEVPEGKTIDEAIALLADAPGVVSAQPNFQYRLIDGIEEVDMASPSIIESSISVDTGSEMPTNDPLCNNSVAPASNQYYLYNSKTVNAWNSARSDGRVTIAVLDSGCRLDHEDLASVLDIANAYDAYNNVPLADSPVKNGDAVGHGTHVCGIVGANANNGVGIAGASYDANILPVKVFNDNSSSNKATASTADIIAGYSYLKRLVDTQKISNLRVINLSLGYYPRSSSEQDVAFEAAISTMRTSYGVLTVCAGGNGDGVSTPYTAISYPSDFDECLAVTSLDRDGGNSTWSDYNAYKDISAPGSYITSTYSSGVSDYRMMSGTSMASPLVAGIAALLWASSPDLSVGEVVAAIEGTADPVRDPSGSRLASSGSHGSINAEAAIAFRKPKTITRLAGNTAIDTMREITAKGFKDGSCQTVVVATLGGYWDALTASALAGLNNCPILLTDSTVLSAQTASEITRLRPEKVYIAGGTAAVSEGVAKQIAALSGTPIISRLSDATAVETALKIYQEGKASWGKTAIVATSATFQDALAVAPYAYAKKAPVFLANATTHELDPKVLTTLRSGGFTRVVIVGGTSAISTTVEKQLSGITIKRLAGATAYETSSAIATWCLSEGMQASSMGIATGSAYYDALAGAALCGKNNSVLVLVSDDYRSAIDSFIAPNASSILRSYIFGGTSAVSEETYRRIEGVLK